MAGLPVAACPLRVARAVGGVFDLGGTRIVDWDGNAPVRATTGFGFPGGAELAPYARRGAEGTASESP
jgi:hypothetical protein